MLIATLPAVHQVPLMTRMFEHPLVGGARYNVGARSPYPPRETLERILEVATRTGKALWVDLKGRQLRVTQWAVPTFGDITLNHSLQVGHPARIWYRGGESSEIVRVVGNRLYVDPPPASAVGQGQAVNVHGPDLVIDGYLTEEDEAYLEACRELGVLDVMLSFVEQASDLSDVRERLPGARLVLKIESPKGLSFVAASPAALAGSRLMAARDDLMINIGDNKAQMLAAVELLIRADPTAILASRIFAGVDKGGAPALGDYSDLRLMELFGYRSFLLSDGLCQRHFNEAMVAWEHYRAATDAGPA